MNTITLDKKGRDAVNVYLAEQAKYQKGLAALNAQIAKFNDDYASPLQIAQGELIAIAGKQHCTKPALDDARFNIDKTIVEETRLERGNGKAIVILTKYTKNVPTKIAAPSVKKLSSKIGEAKLVKTVSNVSSVIAWTKPAGDLFPRLF